MKREEIAELLAEYAAGEISATNRLKLDELFRQDPALEQEAKELAATWAVLDTIAAADQPDALQKQEFYQLLEDAEVALPVTAAPRVIRLRLSWLRTAAAIAACIAAFVIGRLTVEPKVKKELVKVYVKQPSGPAAVPVAVKESVPQKNVQPAKEQVSPVLAQQFRSIFASERIEAVIALSNKRKLNGRELALLGMALSEDPSPNVRLAVINSLQEKMEDPDIQKIFIAALDKQDDTFLQSLMVSLLVDARSNQALPQMMALLDSKKTSMTVRDKIREGIEQFLN